MSAKLRRSSTRKKGCVHVSRRKIDVPDIPKAIGRAARPLPRMVDEALALAQTGLHVLACRPREKLPLTAHGLHDATTDVAIITRIWTGTPAANIGIALALSGLVAIDVDPRHGGNETLASRIAELGPLPETVEALTGGSDGGKHLIFRAPPGAEFRGQLGHGLDIRHRAYIVAAPSVHPCGGIYRWTRSPFDHKPDDLPAKWLAAMSNGHQSAATTAAPASALPPAKSATRSAHSAVEAACARVLKAPAGKRNDTLNEEGFRLSQRYATGELTDAQSELLLAAISAGLAEVEAQKTIASAWGAGLKAPRVPSDYMRTEQGASEFFADLIRGFAYYVTHWGCWIVWNGKVWERDLRCLLMLARTKEIANAYLSSAQAAVQADDPRAQELTKFSVAAQRLHFREAVLSGARAESGIAVSSDAFDTHIYLVNFQNGTYDLDAGVFREHRKSDLLTVMLDRDYELNAKCPLYDVFQRQILPDEARRLCMQRWKGYTLSGDTSEQKMVNKVGQGANGKSVDNRIDLAVLGPYALSATSDMFVESQHAKTFTGLIDAKGKRLLSANETPQGKFMDTTLMKLLTGEDAIKDRRLYCEHETFLNTAKAGISGNYPLRLHETGTAIRRRIVVFKYDQTFSGKQCDPSLFEKLKAELPGITNYFVEGFRAWRKQGLNVPAEIKAASDAYVDSNDVIGPFFEEFCEFGPKLTVPRRALFSLYGTWAHEEGFAYPLGPQAFAAKLQDLGVGEGPRKGKGSARDRTWIGVGLQQRKEKFS